MKPIYFIADAHLGSLAIPHSRQHERRLVRFLDEIKDLTKQGIIKGGMIPKVEACLEAMKNNVKTTHIVGGDIPHSLLLEIFTDRGIGTQFLQD